MLANTTVRFLTNLQKNNTKEWFDKNRKVYEAAREDFISFTSEIIKHLGTVDSTIAHLTPKECIFRINRDVRFSKDKSPYKNNMGMSISRGGKKGIYAGYYFHLQPGGNSFVGGGLWQPMPEELKKVRQEIDYCFDEFKGIIKQKKFINIYKDLEKEGEMSLTRPPKGYDDANPAIDYIKLKHFIASAPISDEELMSKQLAKKVSEAFVTLKPMLDFINRSFDS